ncbi:hypothetical protein ONZ45_g18546 [Pleurotus djamor]|nr:hypothetical protein ONZ45_g18546 [Pleurotus djamor]
MEYFEISPELDVDLVPEGEGGQFRLIVLNSEKHLNAVVNTTVGGQDAYDTNDLVKQHPVNPKLYTICGRSDDQIMHSTGEKTNPVPIEHAVMFGRGKFFAGVIIELNPPDASSGRQHSRPDVLDAIRNSIDEANKFAPTHSKIFDEMIIIADPDRPMEYTAKGTPKRGVILKAYENDIETAYSTFAESAQLSVGIPQSWNSDYSLQTTRLVVQDALSDLQLTDDADLFQHGCDSLLASRISNILIQLMRRFDVDLNALPRHFVYENPTIRRLSDFLSSVVIGAGNLQIGKVGVGHRTRSTQMQDMVKKYLQDLPPLDNKARPPDIEVVALTGSTGNLGCHLLQTLLHDDEISCVYVLNRPTADSGRSRQASSFTANGLDIKLLDSPKLIWVDADITVSYLGLAPARYNEIRSRVTCVIHNAWSVNFNLSLNSMEPLISGTRHLVDLALTSPHPIKFLFTSSIGVGSRYRGTIPEAPISDPASAIGTGYSESKWVAETLLNTIAQKCSFSPTIIRIGQLCGGSRIGIKPGNRVLERRQPCVDVNNTPKISNTLPRRASFVPSISPTPRALRRRHPSLSPLEALPISSPPRHLMNKNGKRKRKSSTTPHATTSELKTCPTCNREFHARGFAAHTNKCERERSDAREQAAVAAAHSRERAQERKRQRIAASFRIEEAIQSQEADELATPSDGPSAPRLSPSRARRSPTASPPPAPAPPSR